MISTQYYFSDSLVLWSAIEPDLASRLLNEIINEAIRIKNQKMALIDEQLIALNPNDKLAYVQRYYEEQKPKRTGNPELHFNTSNLLDPDHYSHKLSSLISQRLGHVKFSSNSYPKNDDQRQMMEFVNSYHEFILNIIRKIKEYASNAGTEFKRNNSRDKLSTELAGIINVISEYQKIYTSIGYRFVENYDNEIEESFGFLERQLYREVERSEIKDGRPFQQRVHPIIQKLIDYLSTLKKCSVELLEEINHHVISTLITEKEKGEIQEALALSYLLDETEERILSLEGEYVILEPGSRSQQIKPFSIDDSPVKRNLKCYIKEWDEFEKLCKYYSEQRKIKDEFVRLIDYDSDSEKFSWVGFKNKKLPSLVELINYLNSLGRLNPFDNKVGLTRHFFDFFQIEETKRNERYFADQLNYYSDREEFDNESALYFKNLEKIIASLREQSQEAKI